MKYWKAFLLYLGAFILQPFLQHTVPVIGENLNLLLCLTVILTFLYDNSFPGITWGLVFGLASDVIYGLYAGPSAFALILVGIVVYVLKEFVNIENFFSVLLMTLFSTWIYTTVYWVIYFFIGSPYTYIFAMKTVPWQLLFNCVVVAIMYFIMVKGTIKHRRDRYFR